MKGPFLTPALVAISLGCFYESLSAQDVLPHPPPPFKGVIGESYKDSTPDKIEMQQAPAGAPNVFLILIDDAGYAQTSTFGGLIPTPTLDRLAAGGLRYTRFHVTAMCSPTRAALLMGRNHHSVGMGIISDFATGYPGYSSIIPKSAGFVSETLRQNGYSTAAFGKWHLTPDWETSPAGPFDRWPTHQGFDHFYGFLGAWTNQWVPKLFDDNDPIEMAIPPGRKADYTLNEDLADKTIEWINTEKSIAPNRPFFVYYAPGATHTPLQAPKAWIDKFKGKFDMGWDRYREMAFARQKQLGVIPQDAVLTARPKEIPSYASQTPDERKVDNHLMEIFAGFMAQTDFEIGRIVDDLQETGQLDNTLIFYIAGDNGASVEGGINGNFNDMAARQGVIDPIPTLVKKIPEMGGPASDPHYPIGWAWAGNTPFQWGKQIASHLGGTRDPMVVYWPNRIKDRGGIRTQFHHVIDVAPTILEAAGIPQPTEVNGVQQKPIEGVSMVYTFDDANAPDRRTTQYFEMMANRAIYQDGWMAGARSGSLPWIRSGGAPDFAAQPWELYHLADDYSEGRNLAQSNPDKLKELENLFQTEGNKYQVFPLDPRYAERYDPKLRPSLHEGQTKFSFRPGAIRIPEGVAPNTKNTSHVITATVDMPKGGASGVLVAEGGPPGGWSLYVRNGKPAYAYNYFGMKLTTIASPEALPAGRSVIKFEFVYDGGGLGKGATGRLFINDRKVASGRIPQTEPVKFSVDETFDVGEDAGAPAADYESPFAFTGSIKQVDIDVAPQNLTDADKVRLDSMKKDLSESQE
jgi:arylsulfatase